MSLDHRKVEREADEAFLLFMKTWPSKYAGTPTAIEVWHHAYRAGIKSVSSEVADNGCGPVKVSFGENK